MTDKPTDKRARRARRAKPRSMTPLDLDIQMRRIQRKTRPKRIQYDNDGARGLISTEGLIGPGAK